MWSRCVWVKPIGGFHVTSSPPCWWTVNKRSLISSFCLSTSICSFQHCYLCLPRLHENHLYHSRPSTSRMFESATQIPSWLLYSLERIRCLYYAYIAHSRLRVEQSTQTLSSIPHIHHDHCPCRGKWTAKLLFAVANYISQHALGATSTPPQSILGFVDIKKNALLNVNAQSA